MFNLVREIASRQDGRSISFFCETAADFIDYIDAVDGFTIVKCHFIDDALMRLIYLLDAKIIVTTRDPRDCIVSQIERFSRNIQESVSDLSKSLSSIAMIPDNITLLHLSYEDDPFGDIGTVHAIARFMDIDLAEEDCRAIFEAMDKDTLSRNAQALADAGHDNLWFDPATHWHPHHIGDGAKGKWQERLPAPYRASLTEAFMTGDTLLGWPRGDIVWDADMFSYYDNRTPPLSHELVCDGSERCLIGGPYFYLPAARWTLEFLIEPVSNDDIVLKIDVFSIDKNQSIIGLKRIVLKKDQSAENYLLDIINIDYLSRIEARVHSTGDGKVGAFRFNGIRVIDRGGRGLHPSPKPMRVGLR